MATTSAAARLDDAMRANVVVPYAASNSSVRTRALHWIDRLADGGRLRRDQVGVSGPGFDGGRPDAGTPLLLLRNARRLTRGRTEARLLRRAAPGVYDLDDGLPWDDGRLPGLGRWWKRPFPRSLVARRAASAADRVIAGNDTIAEWAAGWCADVRVVPTCVEPDDYRRRTGWELGERPVIGWIGSPATEHYLAAIAPALEAASRRHGARVEAIGATDVTAARLGGVVTVSPWTPDADLRIAEWDVGIMPLADGVYERAKCGYKLLQYAASAVPAVGSPVGVNRDLLAAMDGWSATTLDEWTDALDAALGEPATRRAGRAERGLAVADRYSYDTWEPAWVEAVGW